MALASTKLMRFMHCSRVWWEVTRTDWRYESVTMSAVFISAMDASKVIHSGQNLCSLSICPQICHGIRCTSTKMVSLNHLPLAMRKWLDHLRTLRPHDEREHDGPRPTYSSSSRQRLQRPRASLIINISANLYSNHMVSLIPSTVSVSLSIAIDSMAFFPSHPYQLQVTD